MVLKQGEGYKPRGKTSAVVGTSEVQLQLPLEARKQEQAPMSMRTVLHGGLPGGCPHSPQSAKELAVSCKSSSGKHLQVPSVEAQPLQVVFHLIGLPAAANLCMWILSQTWRVGKPHQHCPARSLLVGWLGLHPGETAFQQVYELPNSRQVWADGDVLCFIPVQKKYFYYQAWSVWSLNICCSLLGAADRGITGGLWFTTFVFIYICAQEKRQFARFESA